MNIQTTEEFTEKVYGITITKSFKNGPMILAADFGEGVVWHLGQVVHANGRMFVAEGTLGIIVKIYRPDSDGHTTNILSVFFEGGRIPLDMKPKDLEPSKA